MKSVLHILRLPIPHPPLEKSVVATRSKKKAASLDREGQDPAKVAYFFKVRTDEQKHVYGRNWFNKVCIGNELSSQNLVNFDLKSCIVGRQQKK